MSSIRAKRQITRRTVVKGGCALAAGIALNSGVLAQVAQAAEEADGEKSQLAFWVDTQKCDNCLKCVEACVKENQTPEGAEPRRRVGTYMNSADDEVYITTSCMHCAVPPCEAVCPAGAIIKRDDGIDEFQKDKRRRRTVTVEAVTRSPKVDRAENGENEPRKPHFTQTSHNSHTPNAGQERRYDNTDHPQRRSYNPNFSADNRFIGGGGGNRDYERRPRSNYDAPPERDFNRWDTPSHSPDRPQRQGYRPREDRPYGERKPYGPRPEGGGGGNRPYGNKQGGGVGGKPYGPKKPFVKKGGGTPAGVMNPGVKPDFYPSYSIADTGKELRLNRFIAMSGKCSRREADELIAAGDVMVNGSVITEMGVKVMPTDDIRLKGERLSNEKKVYIVMNKPKGFVTSIDDPHADRTVMDIVRNACTERIYPVGRLDKSSVGVLLLTNDGDLTEKLTHPSHNKKKVYQVTLERPLTNMDLQKARDGIDLDDGIIIPDAVDFVKPDNRKEVGIEIHSGRNRIVRRIFEELGYGVHKLDRVYFSGLTKKNLKRGQWRFLTDKEVSMLKSGRYE